MEDAEILSIAEQTEKILEESKCVVAVIRMLALRVKELTQVPNCVGCSHNGGGLGYCIGCSRNYPDNFNKGTQDWSPSRAYVAGEQVTLNGQEITINKTGVYRVCPILEVQS